MSFSALILTLVMTFLESQQPLPKHSYLTANLVESFDLKVARDTSV